MATAKNQPAAQQPVDLDLTELLPSTLKVRIGGDVYEMVADAAPSVMQRIVRWMARYRNAFGDAASDEPLDEDELWSLVAQILNCDAEKTRGFGFVLGVRVLGFFLDRSTSKMTSTTPSVSGSDSSAPTEAASPSAT